MKAFRSKKMLLCVSAYLIVILFSGCFSSNYFWQIDYMQVEDGSDHKPMQERTGTEIALFNVSLNAAQKDLNGDAISIERDNTSSSDCRFVLDTSERWAYEAIGSAEGELRNILDSNNSEDCNGYLLFVHRITKDGVLVGGTTYSKEDEWDDAESGVGLVGIREEYEDYDSPGAINSVTAHELGEAFNLTGDDGDNHCGCNDCVMVETLPEKDDYSDMSVSDNNDCCKPDKNPNITHFEILENEIP